MSVKVAVVGLGWSGQAHAAALMTHDDAELVAVVEPNEERRREHAERYNVRGYEHWRDMLHAETKLHAVILATPAAVREKPLEAICQRKLAVLCESPPALDVDAALRISQMIQQAGVVNAVGMPLRYHPFARRVRDLIRGRGPLFARVMVAQPVFDWVVGGFASSAMWNQASCGGPMVEQGIEAQDLIRYLTGDEPVAVQGMAELGRYYREHEHDCHETTVVNVRHASGMLTSHVHNWSHQGRSLQVQFVGRDFDLTWHMHNAGWLTGHINDEALDEKFEGTDQTEVTIPAQIRAFLEAVKLKDQSQIRSSYADACRSLRVCHAAQQAANTAASLEIPAPAQVWA